MKGPVTLSSGSERGVVLALTILLALFAVQMPSQVHFASARAAAELNRDDWATSLLNSVVEREGRSGGDTHLLVESLIKLAEIAWRQTRFVDAEALLRRAIAVQGISGEPPLSLIESLGRTLHVQGRLTEAAALYEESLQRREGSSRLPGIRHAAILEWLAAARREQRRLDDAEALYRRALAIRESALPSGDPRIASSFYGLGTLFRHRGMLELAEFCLERALDLMSGAEAGWRDVRRLAWGSSTDPLPNRGMLLREIGSVYARQGRHVEAEHALFEALDMANRRGVAMERVAAYRELGNLARRRGQLGEAESRLRAALDSMPEHLGSHIDRAIILTDLAALLVTRGRSDEVDDLLASAARIAGGSATDAIALRVRDNIGRVRHLQRENS